jgi:hypothetical protein
MKAPSAPATDDHPLSTDDLARVDGGIWNSDLPLLRDGSISRAEYERRQRYYKDHHIVF